MATFAEELMSEIVAEYLRRGHRLGWRLLYGPATVLDTATVAFIGLNPGGDRDYPEHPSFACADDVSAYETERWNGHAPGESPLQRQVRQLFAQLGVEAASTVLAGNLVPFRSPDWKSLPFRTEALTFGEAMWRRILERAKPRTVVTMGKEATMSVQGLLRIRAPSYVPVGWGDMNALVGTNGETRLIGLPHLSRFKLFGRAPSREPLAAILAARPTM